eukprot:517208-Amphidinium_carterae.1
MITRGQLRPRGSYNYKTPRGTTPQPRQRVQRVQHDDVMTNDFIPTRPKVEDVNDLTGQEYFADEYFAEEAAKEDDIENIDNTFGNRKFN